MHILRTKFLAPIRASLFILVSVAPVSAVADCEGPAAIAGTMQWNEESAGVQYCDGTYWKSTSSSTTTDSCSSALKGSITYRSSDLQYCDGANYVSMSGATTGTSCVGSTAGSFTFDSSLGSPKWCDGVNWRLIGTTQLGVFAGGRGATSVDASAYTFSNVAIGTASISRFVLVGVVSRSASNFQATSVSVGGVAATVLVSHEDSGSTSGFFIAEVPTGTTANVVVTFNGQMVRCAIATWSLANLNSASAHATYLQGESSGMTRSIEVPAGGAAFGIAGGTGSTNTINWTNMTKAYSSVINDDFRFLHTAATLQTSVPLTSRSISVANTSGNQWANKVGTVIVLR